MNQSRVLVSTLSVAVLVGSCVLAASPTYAGQSTDTVTCDGHVLTIRTNNNNGVNNWASVQILDGATGHLTPVSFSGTLTDTTIDEVVFEFTSVKGGGHAGNHQPTTACTQHQDGTLGDFLDPGEQPPPGTALTDDVTFDFTAVVAHHG